jgi:hypothetical protein
LSGMDVGASRADRLGDFWETFFVGLAGYGEPRWETRPTERLRPVRLAACAAVVPFPASNAVLGARARPARATGSGGRALCG